MKLGKADLRYADLRGVLLKNADLREVALEKTDLRGADLSWTDAREGRLKEANLEAANLFRADLTGANLSRAKLSKVNLGHARLGSAQLVGADLRDAELIGAQLEGANLNGANLRSANLQGADLRRADLGTAALDEADLSDANLDKASLFHAGLNHAEMSRARLTGADLRAASLLQAKLNGAILNDARVRETQRSGWEIKGILCERAFWDEDAQEPTTYIPGEFEKLYSDQTCIELFYQGGVSNFELNTLPALLHHLASLHQGTNIRLKAIEETAGGAKISISVGDANAETVENIRSDAMQVHQAQLVLRDNEILRLETEKKYLETFVSERLIKAMLSAASQQNVFNAPVYGVALSSGNSSAVVNQTVNDNAALLALLEKVMQHQSELGLASAEAALLQAEVDSAKMELGKPEPSPSILSRSLKFVQKIAGEAATKAAGKLGKQVASADWHAMPHQLNGFIQSFK